MRNRATLALIGVITSILCAHYTDGTPALAGGSPGSALQAFAKAANAGKYSEAETYVAVDALAALKGSLGLARGGFKAWCDHITRHGQIKRVEIVNEQIRGEGAKVEARTVFNDGRTNTDVTEMIYEKGHWKIALGSR